jgi:hypothetical protein
MLSHFYVRARQSSILWHGCLACVFYCCLFLNLHTLIVMDPLCHPSNIAEDGSIAALKRRAHDFMHQQTTCDNAGLSYLESADDYEYNMLAIGRMIVQ